MAAAAPYLVAGGTILQAGNQIQQGREMDAQSSAMRRALIAKGKEEEAAAQREALASKKKTDLVLSRGKAVAAASGAGAKDPTVMDVLDDVAAQGELDMLNKLYEGKMAMSDRRQQGYMARIQGKNARRAGYINAAGTIMSGASTLYSNYGGPGATSTVEVVDKSTSLNSPTWQQLELAKG